MAFRLCESRLLTLATIHRLQTLLPTLLCFEAGFASSVITGGIPEMGEHFGVSALVAGLTVCVFVVGFGLGPLLLSPLSEMYGRKIVCASPCQHAVDLPY